MSSDVMMNASNAVPKKRLGPVEQSLLRAIDRTRDRVWTLSADTLPPGMTPDQARHAVHRLANAGLVDRIERGTYVVHPRSGRVPMLPLDLVGAWLAGEPYAVIGWAAAEAHDLTLQTTGVAEVQLTREKAPVEFWSVRYLFTEAASSSVAADNRKIRTQTGTVTVASPGKAIVLLLRQEAARRSARVRDDTRLVLEMLERGLAKRTWAKTDWVRLVGRHGNAQVARRLGYLLELVGVEGAEALLSLRGTSGNKPFAPSLATEGPVSSRWRLVLNDPAVTR